MYQNNSLRKKKYDRNFTIVANDFLKDKRLSWKAKGIIAYIMMLPDDWELSMKELINHSTDGRDALYNGIKELRIFGYCRVTEKRRSNGTIAGCEYEICDRAVFEPYTENPDTEKPDTENPQQQRNDINNNINNNINTKTKDLINKETKNVLPQKDFAPTLFGNSEMPNSVKENGEKKVPKERGSDKKTLFRNSDIYKLADIDESGNIVGYSRFEAKFATPEFAKIDLVYYFHAVADWSDQKDMKRTKNGWLATVRNFIRGDMERGKVHYKQMPEVDLQGMKDYLNNDY